MKKTLSILKWFSKVLALLTVDIFTTIFSPIICLFVTKAEEFEVTGFPSLYPGKAREFLIAPLRIFQTPDAPLDEYWYGDYQFGLKTKYDQAYYDTHWWLRYACRVLWLVRNPSYGFGTLLGYDADGLTITKVDDNSFIWATGNNNQSYWEFTNSKSQLGFCYRAQFYVGSRCLEMYLGYKVVGDTIQGKKLVAMQITPFKKYPKK